jgi:hypothetical protein
VTDRQTNRQTDRQYTRVCGAFVVRSLLTTTHEMCLSIAMVAYRIVVQSTVDTAAVSRQHAKTTIGRCGVQPDLRASQRSRGAGDTKDSVASRQSTGPLQLCHAQCVCIRVHSNNALGERSATDTCQANLWYPERARLHAAAVPQGAVVVLPRRVQQLDRLACCKGSNHCTIRRATQATTSVDTRTACQDGSMELHCLATEPDLLRHDACVHEWVGGSMVYCDEVEKLSHNKTYTAC